MRLLFIAVFAFVLSVNGTQGAGCKRKVCYHTNWSQYRPGQGLFKPRNIDASLCTHMIYTFAKLVGNNLKAFEWNDESTSWSVGLYEEFNNLKKSHPGLKTLLGVGGWNMGSAPFSALVATKANRQAFATSTVTFLRKRKFDGLDLDWEYPANRGSKAEDKDLYTKLVTEVQAAFEAEAKQTGKPKLLLSAAVAAGKPKIDTAYDIPAISQALDFINLMTYDLHGSWETFTGHNSPLYARSDETGDQLFLNLDWAASYWVQKGAPKEKINIGLDLYGRSFTLVDAAHSLPGDPTSGAGTAGKYTREQGFVSYYEVCGMQKSGGQVHMIKDQQVPYIVKGNQWVGYDDPKSIRNKVAYVKGKGFGGIMVWALDLDDFQGVCGQGKYPLMHAINDECSSSSTGHPMPGHTTQVPVNQQVTVTHEFDCTSKTNGFYPSPHSCQQYYICTSGTSYRVKCAEGQIFNANAKLCDWPKNYHCSIGNQNHIITTPPNHVTENPTTILTQKPVTHSTALLHGSSFCKDKPNGIARDPSNPCDDFYDCANGITYTIQCPPGTKFSKDTLICDIASHVQGCN